MKNKQDSVTLVLILTITGIFSGAVFLGAYGPVLGGILGYLVASSISQERRLRHLEKLAAFPEPAAAPEAAGEPEPGEEPEVVFAPVPGDEVTAATLYSQPSLPLAPAAEEEAGSRFSEAEPDAVPVREAPSGPGRRTSAGSEGFPGLHLVKEFFTTGNVILKIGLIVLFFGVSFLLKYAAQRNLVPIELRLTAVALGGLALLAVGWRLRGRAPLYGLTLQGGGIGILYLTVFAAAKLYHLLPFALAFAVMLGLVGLAGVLAVLQDEKWLAIAGSTGGFLAPVLLSTGGGSHVALFSYYLLLNLGIFGIAWFRAWRVLNLLGFVFTYVIGAMWGSRYYQPGYFASVEPFLLASFVLYTVLSILFALKQPVNLKGYVDSPLVFGVPIVTFALQYGLVRNDEYGLAISSVGFGLFYMVAAMLLWRRYQDMRMLVEIYLSFAVVFASLAIPLALDGNWITAAWAMEGAALVWVGVRQSRLRARIFGVLLQFGAGISFLDALSASASSGSWPVLNGVYLSCLLLAAAGFFSSFYLNLARQQLRSWEGQLVVPLLLWALFWWFSGGVREIDHFARAAAKVHLLLVFLTASSLAMAIVAKTISWRHLLFPPLALLPAMVLLSLGLQGIGWFRPHLFAGWGAVAWTLALAGQYRLLSFLEQDWPETLVMHSHRLTLWLLVFVLSRETHWFIDWQLGSGIWSFLAWGAVPAAAVALLSGPAKKLAWPVGRFREAYLGSGPAIIILSLGVWGLSAATRAGDPAPLPYLPLLNPLEVLQMVILLVCLRWALQNREWLAGYLRGDISRLLFWFLGIVVFLWLNAAVARTVHFFWGVDYRLDPLIRSNVFEAAISILWSLSALPIMVLAARKRYRKLWMAGAGLLLLVVLKLFVIDLSGIGTVARIVSFLAVGLLMLLIGYFSPLPPKKEESA